MKRIIIMFTLISFMIYISGCNSGNKYLHTASIEEVKPDKFYKPCGVKLNDNKEILFKEETIRISYKGGNLKFQSIDDKLMEFKLSYIKGIYTKKDSLGNCDDFLRSKRFLRKYLKHIYIYESFDIDSAITVNNEKLVFKSEGKSGGIGKLDFDNNQLRGFNFLSNKYVAVSLDSLKSLDLMKEPAIKPPNLFIALALSIAAAYLLLYLFGSATVGGGLE